MDDTTHLGEFEHLVLLAAAQLGEDGYGVTIRQEIARRAGREVAIGAVYAALERLERRGYVASWQGEPTARRGGRAKRHFRVEAAGARALERARQALERMWEGLELTPWGGGA